jgi:hypothetical protein
MVWNSEFGLLYVRQYQAASSEPGGFSDEDPRGSAGPVLGYAPAA